MAFLLAGPRTRASVLTKTQPQPTKVYLFIRSDDRGMSHSANIGREHAFGTGLFPSTLDTPTARWFQATAAPFVPSHSRSSTSSTFIRPVAPIGQHQPRFTLMVARSGIDDRELGAWATGSEATFPRVWERRFRPVA